MQGKYNIKRSKTNINILKRKEKNSTSLEQQEAEAKE